MPLTADRPHDPKKVLNSRTIKRLVDDRLDTAGIVEVGDMSGDVPGGPAIRLGLLVKANQTIRKFRYRSTNHDVLSSHDPAVEADLNATLLRPWEKGTMKWVGFRVPMEKIPWKIHDGKINVDVEFSLKPFAAGSAQDMVIVFQPGNDSSFGNAHFNYGVSALKPSRAATAPAKPAPKKAAKAARSKSASKGRSTRRSR